MDSKVVNIVRRIVFHKYITETNSIDFQIKLDKTWKNYETLSRPLTPDEMMFDQKTIGLGKIVDMVKSIKNA